MPLPNCAARTSHQRAPRDLLSKLTQQDNVEAYLAIFEQTAQAEQWPRDDWGKVLGPFLTGEAQQIYRDLAPEATHHYPALKAAILACYGCSLPAQAFRYHQWAYDSDRPVQAQVSELMRRTSAWLVEAEGPALLERLVIDCCLRALPPGARRYVAEQYPCDIDHLVTALVEFWMLWKTL